MACKIHIDGGARGNPGPAAAAIVVRDAGGKLLFEAGYVLGSQTNNVAEYSGLLRALQYAIDHGLKDVEIFSDSELLVQQMTGEYRVKNTKLAELYQQAQSLVLKIDSWVIRHVRREENRRADQIVNHCLDVGHDIVEFDAETAASSPKSERPQAPRAADPASRPQPSQHARDESGGAAQPSRSRIRPGRVRPKLAQPESAPPEPARGEPGAPEDAAARRVRVVCSAPASDACPFGQAGFSDMVVAATLPPHVCIHAAHAVLPTIIAVQDTSAQDFSAVPTMTVRCMKRGCGAVFQVAPALPGNGQTHGSAATQ